MEQKNENKLAALGEGKISRLVLSFTATTLAALVLNSVYTMTDALFLSWGVGENAMGGVSVVFPFVLLQGAVSTAVGSGAASIVSRKLGEGKRKAAGEATKNAMIIFYVTAVVITLLGLLFLDPILQLMGVTGELANYAKQYFMIILAGNVFSTGFSSIIRAEGKMLYGALIWVIPITINIALDALFILVLGWGVRGSASATVISQFASFCMSVLFFTRFSTQAFRGARFRWKQAAEIAGIGMPSLIQMGSLSVMSLLLNHVLADVGGTAGINIYAYISKIIAFMVMPVTAVAQALAPVAGYNYGAKKLGRVKQAVAFSMGISLLYGVAACAVVGFLPKQLLSLFTNSASIIEQGTQGLRILVATFLFMPIPMLMGAAFQAAGQKTWAFLMYAANLLFLIPLALILPGSFALNGVWLAYLLSNIGAAILAGIKAASVNKKLKGVL